jgi:hypothetical protein
MDQQAQRGCSERRKMNTANARKGDLPMDPALRLQPGKSELTPEQEAYAQQFIEARIAAMLSCAAVDEAEAEAHLHAAYGVAGVAPPQVRWFDSPPAFVAAHVPENEQDNQEANLLEMISHSLEESLPSLDIDHPLIRALLTLSFRAANSMELGVWQLLCDSAWEGFPSEWYRWWDVEEDSMDVLKEQIAEQSTQAYRQEKWLAVSRLLHEVGEPHAGFHLAAFNELVSGYRLGSKVAWLVHKPVHLECDEQGRLHSEAGMCVQYRDGWGISARHGVLVRER